MASLLFTFYYWICLYDNNVVMHPSICVITLNDIIYDTTVDDNQVMKYVKFRSAKVQTVIRTKFVRIWCTYAGDSCHVQ